jgi:hypothetical protein
MAGISFGENADAIWIVAAWAFRQVLRDLRRDASLDDSALSVLEQAEHLGFLSIERLSDPLRDSLTSALERLCLEILEARRNFHIERDLPDVQTRKMYLDGIRLLHMSIKAARNN